MSGSTTGEDRTRLDGFELDIFKLVREHATSEQWRQWLRVPLEHAAAKGDIDLFTRLMDAGADGSAGWRGCHGRTLLGAAVYGKSEEMVQALLKAGAKDDVDVMFGHKQVSALRHKQASALHVAAACGAEKVANTLMLAGADPTILNEGNQGPLHLAAQAGHHGMVNILLLKGADPNVPRALRNQSPLHLAAVEGHALCISKLIVSGADKNSLDHDGYSPLHLAVRNNRLAAVEELLAAGANLDIRGEHYRNSALDMAASRGYVGVLRALLRHGSSVKASNEYGYTALHCAADCRAVGLDHDNGDVIRMLLEAGADIDAPEEGGSTPLHLAVLGEISGNVRALLGGGANVNARRTTGDTPLHDACFRSSVCIVERLLRWGANEKLTAEYGETAEEKLGKWGRHGRLSSYTDQRDADDERIRHMLARAPADRSWRRRGWLVLARSCPAKVQLANKEGNGGGGGGGNGSRSCGDVGGGGNGTGDHTKTDLARVVGGVVDLNVEGVFRLVVGFL